VAIDRPWHATHALVPTALRFPGVTPLTILSFFAVDRPWHATHALVPAALRFQGVTPLTILSFFAIDGPCHATHALVPAALRRPCATPFIRLSFPAIDCRWHVTHALVPAACVVHVFVPFHLRFDIVYYSLTSVIRSTLATACIFGSTLFGISSADPVQSNQNGHRLLLWIIEFLDKRV
jgi:hypothetical protein